MESIEKELIETDIKIKFPDEAEEYQCLYNNHNEKCYYKVNDEFLMIVDPKKIKEIKQWYQDSKE